MNAPAASETVVQTAAVVYTHLHGVSLGRADRPRVGWYGDMEMQSHAWGVLKSGPLSVTITISPPVPLDSFTGRKDLALTSERAVRRAVHRHFARAGQVMTPLNPSSPTKCAANSACPRPLRQTKSGHER